MQRWILGGFVSHESLNLVRMQGQEIAIEVMVAYHEPLNKPLKKPDATAAATTICATSISTANITTTIVTPPPAPSNHHNCSHSSIRSAHPKTYNHKHAQHQLGARGAVLRVVGCEKGTNQFRKEVVEGVPEQCWASLPKPDGSWYIFRLCLTSRFKNPNRVVIPAHVGRGQKCQPCPKSLGKNKPTKVLALLGTILDAGIDGHMFFHVKWPLSCDSCWSQLNRNSRPDHQW